MMESEERSGEVVEETSAESTDEVVEAEVEEDAGGGE